MVMTMLRRMFLRVIGGALVGVAVAPKVLMEPIELPVPWRVDYVDADPFWVGIVGTPRSLSDVLGDASGAAADDYFVVSNS